jgi:hypothetical protein
MADRRLEKGQWDFAGGKSIKAKDGTSGTDANWGVYEVAFEVDFQGLTATTTDNGGVKTVASLPATCHLLDARVIATETFANQHLSVDLVCIASGVTPAVTAMTEQNENAHLLNLDLDSGASGTAGTITHHQASAFGDNRADTGAYGGGTLMFINEGTNNNTTLHTAGKVMVYIRYIGSGLATRDTTL